MEYLLVMSLSGSTMMGIYFLVKLLLKNGVSARLYYLVAKVAVLFYLVPLPFVKGWYREIMRAVLYKGQTESVQIPIRWTNSIIHAGEKMYVNDYAAVQISVIGVWLLVACILMLKWWLRYVRVKRRILLYAGILMTEKQQSFLQEMKEQCGVRRHVVLYQGQNEDQTITFGIFNPVIICNREVGGHEAELLVRHEMVHIRRLDVLWKLLMRLALLLHWWNPVTWMLQRELERACEYSCDEIAMQGETTDEVKRYLRLLIEEASAAPERGALAGWQNGFADGVKDVRERMENLMRKKKWNHCVTVILVAALTLANSMTVFAYRDTLHQYVSDNATKENAVQSFESDTFSFMPEGTESDVYDHPQGTEIAYEKQFTDTEGHVYSYGDEEPGKAARSCSHELVSGTISEHTKNSDGGCVVRQYHGQRCVKCGGIFRGDRIGVHMYDVCPH